MNSPFYNQQRISPLFLHQYNRYLPTAFNEELSLLQKVNLIIRELGKVGQITNETVDNWNNVMEWITTNGLSDNVKKQLTDWLEDGTMDDLINETLFDEYNQKIENMVNQMEKSLKESEEKLQDVIDNSMDFILNRSSHPVIERIKKRPQVMAHRNLPFLFPENTIEGFYECVRIGVEFFETDLHVTSDGHIVVHHDFTTGRLSSSNLTIETSTLAQLKAIRLDKSTNASFYGNPKIPTIDELFTFIKNTRCVVTCNFENDPPESIKKQMIDKIHQYSIKNNVILSGDKFGHYKGFANPWALELTDEAYADAGRAGNIIGAYAHASNISNLDSTKRAVELGNKYGVPIVIWTAAQNAYDTYSQFDATGVDLIMADRYWERVGK